MDDSPPADFVRRGPWLRGAHEHFERANWFLQLSKDSPDKVAEYRFALAGIYSARAAVEIMLEAAEHQELKAYENRDPKQSRKDLEAALVPDLPFCHLIEKVRIHDFHRFGCIPPNPHVREVFFGGPAKLVVRKGVAAIALPSSGPTSFVTGQSEVKEQRTLCQDDGRFFDETTGRYFPPDEILEQFLAGLQAVLTYFERLVIAGPGTAHDSGGS